MTADAPPGTASIVLAPSADGSWQAAYLDSDDAELGQESIADAALTRWVRVQEESSPRWIVRTLHGVYPRLLEDGVRLRRAWDLLLCHAILRDTAALPSPLSESSRWIREEPTVQPDAPALFSFVDDSAESGPELAEMLAERRRQQEALRTASDSRLALLCAAESTGSLIAEEMTAAGLPWDRAAHEQILVEMLGERTMGDTRPRRMAALAAQIRTDLGDQTLNPDSPPRLLRALHRAGILVESTSRWELGEHEHPAIAPLIAYKKMARLLTANGWAWLAEWVRDGRFRPIYLTGGVVTGRWASAGGGALQIPRVLRPAVRADPGWTLIVADVAQLEPRVLAAMSRDTAMAAAGQGSDLYEGIVRSGVVQTREEAKYAVLGAMYGATTGDSGRLAPRLRTVFPRAMAHVDDAARTGERGGVVSTLLGRSTPRPDTEWRESQSVASDPNAGGAEERRANSRARDRGRFTRNFVVQGTAAEWALLWLAEIRHRLAALPIAVVPAEASGPYFRDHAHLAFFLHDEIVVHAPMTQAEDAAQAVRDAADAATRRLFPGFAIDIPLDLRIAESAAKGP